MHNGVFKSLKDVVHFYNKRNIAADASGKEIAFAVTVKDQAEDAAQIGTAVSGRAARPVQDADVHHAAHEHGK